MSMTMPGSGTWTVRPAGYRAWEGSVELGSGDAVWRWAREELLRWGIKTPERAAFAYRTLPGHPIDGEEAFLLSRGEDGTVTLGIRSLTRPAAEAHWRLAYPGLLVAQSVARRRYLRALSRVRAGG